MPAGETCITLARAMRAIDAIVRTAQERGYCIAISIVDERTDVVASARMDDAVLRWGRNAYRKAYTSAVMGRDTSAFYRELQQRDRSLLDYGDPLFTTLPGGLAVYAGKRLAGGIGVTGAARGADEELAGIGLTLLDLHPKVAGTGDLDALFGGPPGD